MWRQLGCRESEVPHYLRPMLKRAFTWLGAPAIGVGVWLALAGAPAALADGPLPSGGLLGAVTGTVNGVVGGVAPQPPVASLPPAPAALKNSGPAATAQPDPAPATPATSPAPAAPTVTDAPAAPAGQPLAPVTQA